MGQWQAGAVLVVLFLLLLWVKNWLGRHLQGVALLFSGDEQVATIIYYMLLLPGIVLHELSHAVVATLVGVRTRRISLEPKAHRGGAISLGTVHVESSDALRESLIGVAPLLTGSAIIVLLARWKFGIAYLPLQPLRLLDTALTCLRMPDAWLWLYLIFAISNAMLPSEADRRPWLPVLALFGVGAAFLYFSGGWPYLAGITGQWLVQALTYLTLSFGLALAVDLVFGGFVLGLEKLGEALMGRHVEY